MRKLIVALTCLLLFWCGWLQAQQPNSTQPQSPDLLKVYPRRESLSDCP